MHNQWTRTPLQTPICTPIDTAHAQCCITSFKNYIIKLFNLTKVIFKHLLIYLFSYGKEICKLLTCKICLDRLEEVFPTCSPVWRTCLPHTCWHPCCTLWYELHVTRTLVDLMNVGRQRASPPWIVSTARLLVVGLHCKPLWRTVFQSGSKPTVVFKRHPAFVQESRLQRSKGESTVNKIFGKYESMSTFKSCLYLAWCREIKFLSQYEFGNMSLGCHVTPWLQIKPIPTVDQQCS